MRFSAVKVDAEKGKMEELVYSQENCSHCRRTMCFESIIIL